MTEERFRNLFRPTALRRGHKVALLSAALVTAAMAATAGALGHEPTAPGAAAASGSLLTADVAPATATAAPDPDTATAQPAAPAAPSEKILDTSFEYQINFYYCGPAAVHNALTARGIDVSQEKLASGLGTTVHGTDSAFDTTRMLNGAIGADVYQTKEITGQEATPAQMDQLQADVVHAISNGHAVVANIIGGATDASGVRHDFSGGHYVTLVGYSDDGRAVKVADASGMYGSNTYWMNTINMANWIATRGYSA
ncbi:Peptidase_C39 like family protein [Micromonospora rhizosphaerae]|uniref:Peptidase_C39 like family protein n=2 Tax=Micromonospora rhizosphaerae TaxID=568872 RepID=A0A1C6RI46_9ACTN|nr:Peptidase_C39 like family protein [Micromonospora rhizosphaerae]